MDRRTRLAEIFQDTQQFYSSNPTLIESVNASKAGTKLYEDGPRLDFPANIKKSRCYFNNQVQNI